MKFYGPKMDVVRFATALQLHSPDAWQLTTITRVGSSEVYSASIVTGILSEDIVKTEAQNYSLRPTNTSSENTPASRFRRK